ncbi:MAG: DUF2827 family protein [Pseudomonadales bacterium]
MITADIGITFADHRPIDKSLFANGIAQNAIFLYDLLHALGHNVFFLTGKPQPRNTMLIKAKSYQTFSYGEIMEGKLPLALLLEVGTVTTPDARRAFRHQTGTKIVTVQYGHAMIHDMERLFYPMNMGEAVRLKEPDYVWASPHFENSFSYLEMLYSAPIRTAPFIWDSKFMGKPFGKKDHQPKPNINVMEANLSLMKNALIPITIAETICRKDPGQFNQMLINGSEKLAKNEYFKKNILANMSWLSGHNKKILFGPRRDFEASFQKRDILLSHQWGCELNYLYLEALHKNIPLVHNSPRFKEVGYYYEGFDAKEGARACKLAAQDKDITEYHRKAKRFIKQFASDNEANKQGYQALIEEALAS